MRVINPTRAAAQIFTKTAFARIAVKATAATLLALMSFSAAAISLDSENLDRIPFADQLQGWQKLDSRHVVLKMSAQRNYLVTLKGHCHPLGFARNVGVTTSSNSIWAGFDYVTADGWNCAISQIQKVSHSEMKEFTDF